MIEIWRAVVGYEGLYQVSNWGRVKSLARVDRFGRVIPERLLKPGKTKNGYLQVSLCKDGKQKTYYIHRLVGMAFPDLVDWTDDAMDKSFEELTINHLNEDKAVNLVSNLQWCPLDYNLKYGTHYERAAKTKTGVYNTKLSKRVAQYTLNGEFVREWPSTQEIQRQTVFLRGHISACCRGKYKSAYGFIWQYL